MSNTISMQPEEKEENKIKVKLDALTNFHTLDIDIGDTKFIIFFHSVSNIINFKNQVLWAFNAWENREKRNRKLREEVE